MDSAVLSALPDRIQAKIVVIPSGCWIWTGRTIKGGYGRPSVHGRLVLLHRLTWELAYGSIPTGEGYHGTCVLHVVCDNPPCCNPEHMALGTNQDNMDDRNRKGRQARGESMNTAKLTAADVLEIRRQYAAGGISQKQLAQQHSVHSANISRIVNRETWMHLR